MARSADAATSSLPAADLPRPLRADARRNHDLLLAAASEAYAERGVDAALEDIARRAGVGIGTLYRHFPTRDALNEAVYRRELDSLCDSAARLQREQSPLDALSMWMQDFAVYVARKRGMAMALKAAFGADSELFTSSHRRIRDAIGSLVAGAVESGAIRDDVDPEDLLRGMSGICMAADSPDWAERTGRLTGLLVDGLRFRAGSAG